MILTSTAILTFLLAVGLFFFIRASVKDRTESLVLTSDESEEISVAQIGAIFYRSRLSSFRLSMAIAMLSPLRFCQSELVFSHLLTVLAACGSLCLSLVLATPFPQVGNIFLLLFLIFPCSGWFYWQKAGRLERVALR